jgi:hypothetical protein
LGYGGSVEYAYQVKVRSVDRNEEMLAEMEQIVGIEAVSLIMQERLLEV